MMYVGYDEELLKMTTHAFYVYAFSFLVVGFNIYGSSFFTALNNGLVSAVISFLRTLFFQLACIAVLPIFFGVDGVWLSVTVAELLTLCITGTFLVLLRKKYGY